MEINWNFRQQSISEIDSIVERHFDRMLDEYLSSGEDAWDHYDPDWEEVYDLLDGYDPEYLADFVRDILDGDGDLQVKCYEAGLLKEYVDPSRKMKDPDEVWDEVDRVFEKQWENDELMMRLWEQEFIYQPICERLKKKADDDVYDDIREYFNRQHEDDGRDEW